VFRESGSGETAEVIFLFADSAAKSRSLGQKAGYAGKNNFV